MENIFMNGVLNERDVKGEIEVALVRYIIDEVLNLTSYLKTFEDVVLKLFDFDFDKPTELSIPI
jgi:hypothetical protein